MTLTPRRTTRNFFLGPKFSLSRKVCLLPWENRTLSHPWVVAWSPPGICVPRLWVPSGTVCPEAPSQGGACPPAIGIHGGALCPLVAPLLWVPQPSVSPEVGFRGFRG